MKYEGLHNTNIGTCNVLYFKPGEKTENHFHKESVEIEYVYKGNTITHKEGEVYLWRRGEKHQVINDSDEELVIVCLKMPGHSDEDMNFLKND